MSSSKGLRATAAVAVATIAACTGGACAASSAGPAAPAAPASLCRAGEVAVFSCPVAGGKLAALCASADLGESAGTLAYRFGRPGKVELAFPEPPAHPREIFQRGSIGSAGASGDYVRFTRDAHTYTLWADVGPKGERAGVVVSRNGQTLASLPCRTPALNPDENWARVYKARLPREDEPFTPPSR